MVINLYADCAACGHARHHHLGGGACGAIDTTSVLRCPCSLYTSTPKDEGTQR